MQKFPLFNSFALAGDSVAIELDGVTVRARLEYDHDTRPEHADCYTSDQIEAWHKDEWVYVGVVLDVTVNDVMVCEHAASLWGVECNFPCSNKNEYLSDVADELLSEAINEARSKLRPILETLNKFAKE